LNVDLTPAQEAAIKSSVVNSTDPAVIAARDSLDDIALQNLYNATASPDFYVWRTTTPAGEIMDAINWSRLTPAGRDATQAWASRSLDCQGRQFNVQTILGFRDQIATGKARVRTGLQDALEAVPSLANGNTQDAGWANIEAIIKRKATRLEALLATGTGSLASPANLVVEGSNSNGEIGLIVRS
jgi:hypothetical protein